MWILFAVGSAFFAGATSVLAKAGIKSVSSDFATAFRTGVVLIFSWLMVFVVGCQNAVSTITPRALVFLALSGTATGLSWLCYFKALSIGNLSKVVAVDKSSTFLTILLALIFFREPFHWLTGLGIAVMIAGTALMLEKGDAKKAGCFTPRAAPSLPHCSPYWARWACRIWTPPWPPPCAPWWC